MQFLKWYYTVLSGEVLVETEPWGHPFPEYDVSMIVIEFGSGASPLWGTGTGLAAARMGSTSAAILEYIVTGRS